MENSEDLARLEQFVEKLIGSHNQLKKEKNEMMAQMQEKQQEIVDIYRNNQAQQKLLKQKAILTNKIAEGAVNKLLTNQL